jgi:hypothetical protein
MPQLIAYSGYIPYNQSQTCVILSQLIAGFFTQFYLRNYRPRIFKDYSYLVTGAWDGASLLALFILSFAVFGAAGSPKPFPYVMLSLMISQKLIRNTDPGGVTMSTETMICVRYPNDDSERIRSDEA